MSNDLEITSNLDQPSGHMKALKTEFDAQFSLVEKAIDFARDANDPEEIYKTGLMLRASMQVSGLALAKLLYDASLLWYKFGTLDDFKDAIFLRMGLHHNTVQAYAHVWEILFSKKSTVPADVQEQLMPKPIGALIEIARAEPADLDDVWEEIVAAPDRKSIQGIVRKETGTKPNSNALSIVLRRTGTLEAWFGADDDKQSVELGFLRITDEDLADETRSHALTRLIKNGGILRE